MLEGETVDLVSLLRRVYTDRSRAPRGSFTWAVFPLNQKAFTVRDNRGLFVRASVILTFLSSNGYRDPENQGIPQM